MGFKTISTLLISAGLGGAGYSGASYITPLFNRSTPTEDSKLVQQAETAWKEKFKDSNLSNVAFFAVCSKKTTEYEVFDGTKLDFENCEELDKLTAMTWSEQEKFPKSNGLYRLEQLKKTNEINGEKLLVIQKSSDSKIKITDILTKLGIDNSGKKWHFCQKNLKKMDTPEDCVPTTKEAHLIKQYKFQEYFGKVKKVFYVSYDRNSVDLKNKEGVLEKTILDDSV